jgi:hypothetical protein
MQTPVGSPDAKPPIFGGGVDNVCPDNKFKCPPKGPAEPGTAGNFPQGPGSGPIVVLAQPPVFQAPRPVVTATSAAPVAAEPCNCLTKQYLGDGSVLFKDICTKEAAIATPDELKAQAQGAALTVR